MRVDWISSSSRRSMWFLRFGSDQIWQNCFTTLCVAERNRPININKCVGSCPIRVNEESFLFSSVQLFSISMVAKMRVELCHSQTHTKQKKLHPKNMIKQKLSTSTVNRNIARDYFQHRHSDRMIYSISFRNCNS